ncbi:MAG TPA: hypothetical protein VH012_00330 [Acidimicrobiales bacterium]|jgi:hypothetical protein|nr:hypothetical protein [Acidimicrobiales bacterium]
MPTTRTSLHVIATHVLGRRRFAVSGHFGLRASPGGVATPAFGPEPEVVRTAGPDLIHEVGAASQSLVMDGATLAELAALVGADLRAEFSAGAGAPAVGRLDEPMHLVDEELDVLYGWFDLGSRALDVVTRGSGSVAGWSTTQLWPEHFDVGTTLDLGSGQGVNLGFSPGDGFSDAPYAYVGPWGPERPGPADYWNAPFGAVLPQAGAEDVETCSDFLRRGLALLGVTR